MSTFYGKISTQNSKQALSNKGKNKVQNKGNLNCYCCEGKHLSQYCPFKDKECFFCHKKRYIMKVCKEKKKDSSIQRKAKLVKEAESDEVFNIYHQRVIGKKIAPYVANVKIERENVALEINTGASVSILNKKTCDFCHNLSVNLLPISSKLKSYSGELIHPLAKIVYMVNCKGQLCHH